MRRSLILAATVGLALGACASPTYTPSIGGPAASWPVAPELLPPASSHIPAAFGPATWALDPAFAAPTPESTELRILVWERDCSSGAPATGRMSAPVIEYKPQTVTITIGVRPRGGIQSCPLPPGTPAIVRLPQPLGDRTLLDGGHEPPAPPAFP